MLGSFWRSEPAAELRGLAKDGVVRRLLALVELEESGLGHVDLAAHLADFRHVLALELLRHFLQRLDIGGDVLALGAVAAGGGGDEFAVLVAQRHRQAVDLGLGAEGDLLVVAELEEAADAGDEIDDVLLGEGVVERQHRHRVADFLEAAGGRGADFQRQRFQRAQVGESAPRWRCSARAARRIRRPKRSAGPAGNSACRAARFPPSAARARPSPAWRSGGRRAFCRF